MTDIGITPVERGHIRTDVNHIIEGFSLGTADDPDPETSMGEGPVYNLVLDHPEATILWDTGSHPEAGEGHWPAELYAAFEHYDVRRSEAPAGQPERNVLVTPTNTPSTTTSNGRATRPRTSMR